MDSMWSNDELMSFVPTTDCRTPTESAFDFGWEGEERSDKVALRPVPKLCPGKARFLK